MVTDGHVSDREAVVAASASQDLRIFTLGIGSGADELLVRALADVTHAAAEMATANERMSSKVVVRAWLLLLLFKPMGIGAEKNGKQSLFAPHRCLSFWCLPITSLAAREPPPPPFSCPVSDLLRLHSNALAGATQAGAPAVH